MNDLAGRSPVQYCFDGGSVIAEGAIAELTGELDFPRFLDQASQLVGTQQADDTREMTWCTAAVVRDGARFEQPNNVIME